MRAIFERDRNVRDRGTPELIPIDKVPFWRLDAQIKSALDTIIRERYMERLGTELGNSLAKGLLDQIGETFEKNHKKILQRLLEAGVVLTGIGLLVLSLYGNRPRQKPPNVTPAARTASLRNQSPQVQESRPLRMPSRTAGQDNNSAVINYDLSEDQAQQIENLIYLANQDRLINRLQQGHNNEQVFIPADRHALFEELADRIVTLLRNEDPQAEELEAVVDQLFMIQGRGYESHFIMGYFIRRPGVRNTVSSLGEILSCLFGRLPRTNILLQAGEGSSTGGSTFLDSQRK